MKNISKIYCTINHIKRVQKGSASLKDCLKGEQKGSKTRKWQNVQISKTYNLASIDRQYACFLCPTNFLA